MSLSHFVAAAMLAAVAPLAVSGVPQGPIAPRGIGCSPETRIEIQREPDGRPVMSGFGRAVCDQIGPGRVTTVLYKNSEEVGRRTIDTVETNMTAALSIPCAPGVADWLLVVQYTDDLVGMTIQHKFFREAPCG